MINDFDISKLNYYEQEAEDCTFFDVVADITHRCNMTCKNCYLPNRTFPDMEFEKFKAFIKRLKRPVMIRLVGAEPTLHPQLIDFINTTFEHGHNAILVTNGLRLSSANFVKKIKDTGLKHLYISLNGIDNDDWYQEIDEMRCADKKIKAVKNTKNDFNLNFGIIIVKGINEEVPSRAHDLIKREAIPDVTLRFKNVGQLGRYQKEKDENLKMKDMVKLIGSQLGYTEDYIWSHYGKPHRYSKVVEPGTIEFPLDPNNKDRYRGQWVKITDWDTDNEQGIPDPGSIRRGRITQEWKVAPFYEHAKINKNGY